MTTEEKYLRPEQVGKIVGWTSNTLANYRAQKCGPPYVKVRNRILYPADQLDTWILENNKAGLSS